MAQPAVLTAFSGRGHRARRSPCIGELPSRRLILISTYFLFFQLTKPNHPVKELWH
ncbi:hypothetical protein BDW_12145 [Bdellovibrio bacteriovorus W]|nr:hypothetical protein BDW_12145 [Bdellovibrio bacteriovorus W]